MKKFALLCLAVLFMLPAAAALAHDPIILTENQTTPDQGPLLPDGTISFALYGTLLSAGETRGFRVTFSDGDSLYLSLLIPDLPPENGLAEAALPFVELTDPTNETIRLSPTERVAFAEPFTGTNYVRLLELTTPAMGGTYSVVIMGNAPARFTVAVGEREMFGTPVENVPNRDLGITGVMSWYNNSLTADPSTESSTEPATAAPTVQPTSPQVTVPADDSTTNQTLIAVAVVVMLAIGIVARFLIRRRTVQ
jgi:hypothetical protein